MKNSFFKQETVRLRPYNEHNLKKQAKAAEGDSDGKRQVSFKEFEF